MICICFIVYLGMNFVFGIKIIRLVFFFLNENEIEGNNIFYKKYLELIYVFVINKVKIFNLIVL